MALQTNKMKNKTKQNKKTQDFKICDKCIS